MTILNTNFSNLGGGYLFAEIGRKTAAYMAAHPEADVIRLGIGDVTLPLAPAVVTAMRKAVDEMGSAATFHGYGPEQGYEFLRAAIAENDYAARGVKLSASEIFVSDGSKSDVANFQELFSVDCTVAIPDPVYPVYRDTNLMAGRKIVYLPCRADNGFAPELPQGHVDVIYLCSPNNPTGGALGRDELSKWVEYARRERALILFDSAYKAYISDPSLPRSIFEIPGAEEVAVEFRSFSKTAGFTGTRCAYVAIPDSVKAADGNGGMVSLNKLWLRRQTTKFNGVPYIVQRGAEAVFSPEGKRQVEEQVAYYMENARIIREGFAKLGWQAIGGVNAPYIWVGVPGGDSMAFFEKLLEQCQVVGTPGVGFGSCGEGWFRLTAFGNRERTIEAMARISSKF
ncbi:MAG: LL-diaminopimelate aminotransferase [Victivallaceae bacterium]|nr:LL-diaminopimelate aminotransferase [Victivallaceae bacterium]